MSNNYILIGMPGCGKSTVGGIAAEKTGLGFIDIDIEIEKKHGGIPKIFIVKGESWFRKREREELAFACKGENAIISTGGGIVENPENKKTMRGNVVIFIDREPEEIRKSLDDSGRPLMKNNPGALDRLYKRRYEK